MNPYECKYCLIARYPDRQHECERHRLQSRIDDLCAQISDLEQTIRDYNDNDEDELTLDQENTWSGMEMQTPREGE